MNAYSPGPDWDASDHGLGSLVDGDAERALIGALLKGGGVVLDRVRDQLQPEQFGVARHQHMYRAILATADAGREINVLTIRSALAEAGTLADTGGNDYLVALLGNAITSATAPDLAEIVTKLAARRRLAEIGADLSSAAARQDVPVADLIAAAREGVEGITTAGAAYPFTVASTLADRPVPDRRWLVPGFLPTHQVTLLGGDGGTGKSLLGLQLMVAAASGTPWLGVPVEQCRTFGLFAEDDDGELHRRLDDVARAAGVDVAELDGMAWRSAVADPHALVVPDDAGGGVRPSAYYQSIVAAIRKFGARLVVLDAAANLFGGDEIKRANVVAFVTLLRTLAVEIDGAVLLLAHPSVAGMKSGSGLSGSTGWNNSVRSRIYFAREDGEADTDVRVLTTLKSNYGPTGAALRVRWQAGAFVALDAPGSVDRSAMASKAERVFLALLRETYNEESWVSSNASAPRNFAPRVFVKHPGREGIGEAAFTAAMRRLIDSGRVEIEKYGKESNRHSRLRIVE